MVQTSTRLRPQLGAGPRGTARPPPCSLARVILSALAKLCGCRRGQWGSLAQARRSTCWDSEAATKVVPSFSHASSGQLCGDAEARVYWDLPLARPDLFLARRGWRTLTWPPRSRSHALGRKRKIQESREQACVPSCGSALRESHGSLVSPRRTCVLGAPAVAQRGGCYFGFEFLTHTCCSVSP